LIFDLDLGILYLLVWYQILMTFNLDLNFKEIFRYTAPCKKENI